MKEKKPGIFKEFLAFINKGNALALAVGVIIGGCFTAIVTAVNKKILSPIIGHVLGGNDLSESLLTVLSSHEELDATTGEMVTVIDNAIYWGAFVQAVIDFLLTAIVLFLIVKIVTAVMNSAKKARERLEALKAKEEEAAPVVEEEAPAPAPVEDPADIKLLQEIRDLLKAQAENKSE